MSSAYKYKGWVSPGVLFVVAVVSFFLLDRFFISVGDDLAYMFADKKLYELKGARITSLLDCLSSQCGQYLHTNGRFLVHTTVQAMVSLVPRWVYVTLNSLMFGLLWVLLCRMSGRGYKTSYGVFMLAAMWLLLPAPGITMLGLVSVAVNYLWVGVAMLGWLYLFGRCSGYTSAQHVVLLVVSIVIGSLQESYSLPICGGLLVWWLSRGRKMPRGGWWMVAGFIIGAVIEVFAPGNFYRVGDGSGFTLSVLKVRNTLLWNILLLSPVSLLALMMAGYAIYSRRRAWRFVRQNVLLFVAIICAILLACITFTSDRQLFCPYLFSILLIGRLVKPLFMRMRPVGNVSTTVVMALPLALMLTTVYGMRSNTMAQWQKFDVECRRELAKGEHRVFADVSKCNFNNRGPGYMFLRRYDSDPFSGYGMGLFGLFKKCYGRLYGGKVDALYNVLPYPRQQLIERVDTITFEPDSTFYTPIQLDCRHYLLKVPKKMTQYIWDKNGVNMYFEEFTEGDYRYIVTNGPQPVKFK